MAHEEAIHEKLIAALGWRPRHVIEGMIRTDNLKRPSDTRQIRRSTLLPLGDLDVLPLELLHIIFSMLDFRTLLSVLQTCGRGVTVVESSQHYRDLVRHAAPAMAALGRTRMLRHHSIATLHAALLSQDCASCGSFGAFLHVTTCVRCCYSCLWRNQSLWMIPPRMAEKCFGLPASSVKELPALYSVPGRYHVRCMIQRSRRVRLVSVAAAKELAIRRDQSEESWASDLEIQRMAGLKPVEYHRLRWLQAAPLQPPGPGLAARPIESNRPNDDFCGMASVPFPSLLPGGLVEGGLWCRGCEYVYRKWSQERVVLNGAAALIPVTLYEGDALNAMQFVARTTSAFLDHVKLCAGARELEGDLLAEFRLIEDER